MTEALRVPGERSECSHGACNGIIAPLLLTYIVISTKIEKRSRTKVLKGRIWESLKRQNWYMSI